MIMSFWNGRVSFTRYRVGGERPLPFGEDFLDRARNRLICATGAGAPIDGVVTGWSGGDHLLDLNLDPAKNIVDDAFHLAIRIDADKLPGALLRAYTQIEIEARAQANPSGRATKAERQEAKQAARQRLEAEAADGRFRRLTHFPVLWDGQTNTLYAGSTSTTVLDRVQILFRETFDRRLEPITAGSLARPLAGSDLDHPEFSVANLERGHLTLAGGTALETPRIAWAEGNAASLDFLGNEFLVWVWHTLQNDGDTIRLSDGSDVTVMLSKTLTLDCPRGETGRDHLTDESPARLPEALRALQAGKLPRKAGMILARQGSEYELTIQAETLAVSGSSLPKPDGSPPSSDTRIARVQSVRHLARTIDLLFQAYLIKRSSSTWSDELSRIQQWLKAA
jgi:hypothetical protein